MKSKQIWHEKNKLSPIIDSEKDVYILIISPLISSIVQLNLGTLEFFINFKDLAFLSSIFWMVLWDVGGSNSSLTLRISLAHVVTAGKSSKIPGNQVKNLVK